MIAAKILNIWETLPIESKDPDVVGRTFPFPRDKPFIKGRFQSRFDPSVMLPFMSFSVVVTEKTEGEEPSEPKGSVLTVFKMLHDEWAFTMSEDGGRAILVNEMGVQEGMLPVIEKLANKEPAELKLLNGDGKQLLVTFVPAEIQVN